MSNLKLYSTFHANLQFSSIPKSDYAKVINNCYWPLVKMVDLIPGLKIGVEFSGETLLEIERIDPKLIAKLKDLIERKKIELVGSGYAQSIFPLIPYEVNLLNLRFGLDVYLRIFNLKPKIFYVNEQTISSGVFDAYCDSGIGSIMIDFDSTPDEVRLAGELLYGPSMSKSLGGDEFRIIWSSTIAFQKFQRFIFDEISEGNYLKYLKSHTTKTKRFFPLYCGDWEIFGYSPKGVPRDVSRDFARIKALFTLLANEKFDFVLPSAVLAGQDGKELIRVASSQEPIPSKKQIKYNASRWSIAGKYAVFRNSSCFRIYEKLSQINKLDNIFGGYVKTSGLLRELVSLWGSDFRTNTSEDKTKDFEKRIGRLANQVDYKLKLLGKKYTKNGELTIFNPSDSRKNRIVCINIKRPGVFHWEVKVNGKKTICQLIPTEFGEKGKILNSDLIFQVFLGPREIGKVDIKPIGGNLSFKSTPDSVKTDSVDLTLDSRTGGTIRRAAFVKLSQKALFGLVYHGWYKNPELSSDWFSGHCIFEGELLKKHTDLNQVNIKVLDSTNPLAIPIYIENETEICKILKIYYVYKNIPRIDLRYIIDFKNAPLRSARIANVTLNPKLFDPRGLSYWTTNGGKNIERYALGDVKVDFCQPHSLRITSRGCLGATDNWLGIGDSKKTLLMVWDKSNLAACPLLHFEKTPQGLYGRIQFSIGESDETGYPTFSGRYSFKISYMGVTPKLLHREVTNLRDDLIVIES